MSSSRTEISPFVPTGQHSVQSKKREKRQTKEKNKSDKYEIFSLKMSYLRKYRRVFLNRLPQEVQDQILIQTRINFYDDLVELQSMLFYVHENSSKYPGCTIVQDCSPPLESKPSNASVPVLLNIVLDEKTDQDMRELLPKFFYAGFVNSITIGKTEQTPELFGRKLAQYIYNYRKYVAEVLTVHCLSTIPQQEDDIYEPSQRHIILYHKLLELGSLSEPYSTMGLADISMYQDFTQLPPKPTMIEMDIGLVAETATDSLWAARESVNMVRAPEVYFNQAQNLYQTDQSDDDLMEDITDRQTY